MFKTMEKIITKKYVLKSWIRDHSPKKNIFISLESSMQDEAEAEIQIIYLQDSGR